MPEASSSPLDNFQFTVIGQEPALLKRLSAPGTVVQETSLSPSPSPSPLSSPKAPASTIAPSISRKSLLEALAGFDEQGAPNKKIMLTDQHPTEATNGPSRATSSSGAPTSQTPNGELHPALNGDTRPSPNMNGSRNKSYPPASEDPLPPIVDNPVPAPSRPVLNTLLPVPSLSFSALSALSPSLSSRQPVQQDDALDVVRRALQRLQAESSEYSKREEETRQAMARQQDQAARWHARADAIMEPFAALFAQCERQIIATRDVMAEVQRLQDLVRQHKEEVAECRRTITSLETQNAELTRRSAERERLAEARTAEIRQAAERAAAEKTELEVALRDLQTRLEAAERRHSNVVAERERELLARLAEQQRAAEQEKQELLAQLEEQKRMAEFEKQRRMAELVAEKDRLEGQLREEHFRVQAARAKDASNLSGHSSPLVSDVAPPQRPASASLPVVSKDASMQPAVVAIPSEPAGRPTATVSATPKQKPQLPIQDLKPPSVPPVGGAPQPHSPPAETLAVKTELVTPALKTNTFGPTLMETPTTKRVKSEPSTLGRKLASKPSSTSPSAGQPSVATHAKAEVPTPLIDRLSSAGSSGGLNNHAPPRREQSLDYESRSPRPNGATSDTPLQRPPVNLVSRPTAHTTAGASTSVSHQTNITRQPPTSVGVNASVLDPPLPAVSSVMPSTEFPPVYPPLPDLAYPSREGSPALIMSAVPSGDRPTGLDFLNASGGGAAQRVAPRPRESTPPPQADPMRGRAQRNIPPHVDHYSPPPTTWEPSHWVPTPDRDPPNRERYSPPVRHKRSRDDDGSMDRSQPRRARISSPTGDPSRSAGPLPRRPSEQHECGSYPYPDRSRSRSRSRSPRPYRPPARERSPSPRNPYLPDSPRRYSHSSSSRRSPSPPRRPYDDPYANPYTNGAPANGYAPPPAEAHNVRSEAEVRFPQVVPALPPPPTAAVAISPVSAPPKPVRKANAASRGKQRAQAAPATPAARSSPTGTGAPAALESAGEISLLQRMSMSSEDAAGSEANNTPGKASASKSTRGRGAPSNRRGAPSSSRGAPPSSRGAPASRGATRGRRGDPASRGGNANGGTGRSLAARMNVDIT